MAQRFREKEIKMENRSRNTLDSADNDGILRVSHDKMITDANSRNLPIRLLTSDTGVVYNGFIGFLTTFWKGFYHAEVQFCCRYCGVRS